MRSLFSTKLPSFSASCRAMFCREVGSVRCITTVCVGWSSDACQERGKNSSFSPSLGNVCNLSVMYQELFLRGYKAYHQLLIDDHLADNTMNGRDLQLKHLWERLHAAGHRQTKLGQFFHIKINIQMSFYSHNSLGNTLPLIFCNGANQLDSFPWQIYQIHLFHKNSLVYGVSWLSVRWRHNS